jgi:hypothetical protein
LETTERFEYFAILELMGHRRLAGKVTEAAIGGGSFIRIDMPMKDGSQSTQFYSPGSIYCITPTTEEIARTMSMAYQLEPVNQWEFKQLQAANPGYSPDGLDEVWCPSDVNTTPGEDNPGDESSGSDFKQADGIDDGDEED